MSENIPKATPVVKSDDTLQSSSSIFVGVDFQAVATHEIGHSLGLAHSTVFSSIMFPYYKGPEESSELDYDDIMALYELYSKSTKCLNQCCVLC